MAKKSTGRAYSKAQVEKQRRARGNAIRRAIFVVAVLAVVALAVIFLVLRGGEGASVGENAIGSAFSPLQNAFSSATKWVRDLFQGWRNYDELGANYQDLFLENQQLSLELQGAEEALAENQRLLGLLRLRAGAELRPQPKKRLFQHLGQRGTANARRPDREKRELPNEHGSVFCIREKARIPRPQSLQQLRKGCPVTEYFRSHIA